jgi:hypothetical protein
MPNPYNVKNSSPVYFNDQEKYFYENLKPEYQSIYSSATAENKTDFRNAILREQIDTFKKRNMNSLFEFYENAITGKWKKSSLPPIF